MVQYTIDELAQAAATKVSTVRMYQQKGLLPPPTMAGRVGVYGPNHLARLQLIGRLQTRGYSLAAIADLVDSFESGRSLADVLEGDESPTVTPADFAALFPDGIPDPVLVQQAIALRLVEIEPDGVRLASRRMLDVGSHLGQLGVSLAEVFDEYAVVQEAIDAIAQRFLDLFHRHVWDGRRPLDDDELAGVVATYQRLRGLGVEIVAVAMRVAIDRLAETALGEAADTLSPPSSRTSTPTT